MFIVQSDLTLRLQEQFENFFLYKYSCFPRESKRQNVENQERDILSQYGNMDVMLDEGNTNSIERELDSLKTCTEGQQDLQSLPNRKNSSPENEIRDIENRNGSIRPEGLSESINILFDEMNERLSRETDSLMDLRPSQINRAKRSAIIDRIILEIQNTMGSLALSRNGPEPCTALTGYNIANAWKTKNMEFTKKDSRSTCDLRKDTHFVPYRYHSIHS